MSKPIHEIDPASICRRLHADPDRLGKLAGGSHLFRHFLCRLETYVLGDPLAWHTASPLKRLPGTRNDDGELLDWDERGPVSWEQIRAEWITNHPNPIGELNAKENTV